MAVKKVKIYRYNIGEGVRQIEDEIALDEAVCIYVNMEYYRTLIASPDMVEELGAGHLLCEGVIDSLEEIQSIEVASGKIYVDLKREVDLGSVHQVRRDIITTACGAPNTPTNQSVLKSLRVDSDVSVSAQEILGMVKGLNVRDSVFRRTGGTHIAMLYQSGGEEVSFAEDVGRHNAVDKVIGDGMLRGVDLGCCVLVSSGRQSGEMVLKAARAGIPVVVSRSAPIESGRRVAQETGITLVCFVRGRRMNIVIHPRRVTYVE